LVSAIFEHLVYFPYPEQLMVAAKAVGEIENNPSLKARVIGALKAGGTEALKGLINHPLASLFIECIKGWKINNLSAF
jgi:pantoate kinase